jgi:phosphoglycerol transferase MdoB-like AlkP superfamily enzyme
MPKRTPVLAGLIPEPVYMSLIYRIGGMYLLFGVCRFLFILFNLKYFTYGGAGHQLNWIWGGLVFDTVAIFYVNILYIILATLPLRVRYKNWYQVILSGIFVIANSVALAANIIDVFYYPFTLTRTTASVFRQFSNESNLGSLFFRFLTGYWYGTLIFIMIVFALVYLVSKTRPSGQIRQHGFFYYFYAFILLVFTCTLFVGGVRGGYKHSTRPITLSNAGQYVIEPREVSIVLNTPFCILKTLEIKTFSRISYFTQAEADRLFPVIHIPPSDNVMIKKNVVIIILESFGKEFIGFFNRDPGKQYPSYTPFIDSLCRQSLTFKYSFANGRKSIDIMPTVLVSIPSMVEPFILTECFSDKMQSLPYLLGREGYHSSFFHGAPNGSMGYLAFSNLIGIDQYFGMNEYGNRRDFDGYWAIWDEEFFHYYAEKLSSFSQPFVSAIFSASSHHPFVLPERYAGKFPEGPHPINKCIGYTDMSLKRFFEKASEEPWFKNTLFVITADHCQSQPQREVYRSSTGSFEVPVIFYTPDGSLKGEDPRLIQQIDIMPVVLGQLKYNKPYFAFGSDVLNGNGDNCVVNYINGTYQLFYRDFVLIADEKETRGLYRFKTDRLLQNNLSGQAGTVQDTLENKMKAFIQQYNNRMLDNRISIPETK